MNIYKVKEFMAHHQNHVKEPFQLLTSDALSDNGIEHIEPKLKTVMMQLNALMNMDEVIILEKFPNEDFPYKAYTFLTDIKFYSLVTEKDVSDYPMLQYLADQLEKEEYLMADEDFLVDAAINYAQ